MDTNVSNVLCYGNAAVSVADADETTDLRAMAVTRGLLTDTYAFPNHQFSLSDDEVMAAFSTELFEKLDSFLIITGTDADMGAVLANGLCLGLSATTVLAHNGVLTPDEIQSGASTLHDVTLTDNVECLIGKYAIAQAYPKFNNYIGYQKTVHSYEEQISILLETAARCEQNGDYFLINFDTPKLGHAVVGMGMVTGTWNWNDISYDTCILVNDSNLQNAEGVAVGFHADGCIYVNSETLQFYIPCYDSGTENGSSIGFVTDDVQLLSYRAPLHGTEQVDVFDESAGYNKLTFWYSSGKKLPVCMAKTQYSFSDDKDKLGAPEHFTVTVRGVRVSAGAGFIVALTGDIMTMPGLPKKPAAEGINVTDDGKITGLF